MAGAAAGVKRSMVARPSLLRHNARHLPAISEDVMTVSIDPVEFLSTLIQFDTTNPPGNEGECARWIVAQLESVGVTPTVFESNGRPNVVARIEGDGTGGGPILMTGHMDVVPVDREMWTADPFAAEVRDGYLFGRGTVDMKYMLTHCLIAFMRAAQSRNRPTRDLIFAAVSDEEEGCTDGSQFLVEQHPDAVRAEYMLGEFGGFSLDIKGLRYYPIQIAEKGACQLRMTVKGDPGHGSVPHDNNAVVKLARAVHILGTTRLPMHGSRTVDAFLGEMAAAQSAPDKWVLPLLTNRLAAPLILEKLIPDPGIAASMAANLANTVSPTGLSAGKKLNVIPGSASALLDGRLIPGQTKDDFLAELRAVIGDGFEFEVINYFPGRENTVGTDDPLYRAICDNVRATDPAGIPIPYMLTGFTDAQYFSRLGIQCFGYAPLRFPAEDEIKFNTLIHGHDERLHIDGYRWGSDAFWKLVSEFTGLG